MRFDFTTIMDRRGKDSIAADCKAFPGALADAAVREGFDTIPMWVADMNFPTVPAVTEAIIKRASHPAFGYFAPTDEYFDSIIRWHKKRNGVEGLSREHIGYENGVLGGVVSAAAAMTPRGGNILVHSPTYIGFTGSLENCGYRLVRSPLVKDSEGIWRMDLEDMERKIVSEKIHTAILCSPHNPLGRVWEKEELLEAMELFKKHDVYVISDEIWSDLLLYKNRHIPTQSVSEDARRRTAAFYAPSKTFNLAGLVGSYHVIYNKALRDRIEKESSLSHYNSMNVLSMHALIGAYSEEGEAWVDELCEVLSENMDYACNYIDEHFKGVSYARPEGTYMLFLDCSRWCEDNGVTIDELQAAGIEVGVIWQDGRPFHGPCHIRLNLALPLSRVKEAFDRLDRFVFNRE
ncbi:MAG: aminotransferase class I/II-fold pyridoxal phosphate-dependent enzyme [Clostridia bacterium]|nr:aminotransferase class I/II-fold pyridoxal phosphate-dependent enzyme [Clostridia bacterium]